MDIHNFHILVLPNTYRRSVGRHLLSHKRCRKTRNQMLSPWHRSPSSAQKNLTLKSLNTRCLCLYIMGICGLVLDRHPGRSSRRLAKPIGRTTLSVCACPFVQFLILAMAGSCAALMPSVCTFGPPGIMAHLLCSRWWISRWLIKSVLQMSAPMFVRLLALAIGLG